MPVLRVNKPITNNNNEILPAEEDIIINRVKYETSYDKDGNRVIKRIKTKVNLTKKINETAKALKTLTAEEKLANIQQTLRG